MEQRESTITDIMKGSDLIDLEQYDFNDSLLSTNIEDNPLFIVNKLIVLQVLYHLSIQMKVEFVRNIHSVSIVM
jgi:hypothetical protein